jgi:hypothetical protein
MYYTYPAQVKEVETTEYVTGFPVVTYTLIGIDGFREYIKEANVSFMPDSRWTRLKRWWNG